MIYPYVHIANTERATVFYHPVNMAVAITPPGTSIDDFEKMISHSKDADEWIVSDGFDYEKYVDTILRKTDFFTIDIKTLKMFTTTLCNLDCDYCLIEKNLKSRKSCIQNLSLEDGIQVIDKFSRLTRNQKPSPRTIMLYGGEPLMNRKNLFSYITYIRDLEEKNMFNGPVEIDLECNGTLVTDEDAEFLKKNNVFILVSLDGTEDVHNAYRKTPSQEGSYADAKRGYDILIRHGCDAVISSVFTDQYADHVERCIDATVNEIKPKSMGLNLFHVLEDAEIKNDRTSDNYDKYIQAFELAREKGLYIEHIMRRIRPLTSRVIRIKDCGACGNRIVSDVNGNIGICEGLVGDTAYFFERDDIESIRKDPEFIKWSSRTPFKMECCKGCRAIAICGGGCVSNAIRQNGDVFTPDNYICESSKRFIDWALTSWVELSDYHESEGLHILSEKERMRLLGNLGTKFDIPLQTVSKQYEEIADEK